MTGGQEAVGLTAGIAAMSAVVPIAGSARYTVVPFVVATFMWLGATSPPATLSWWATPAALGGSAALLALSVVSERLGRPTLLRQLERAFGLPLYMAALAAIGMSAAIHSGAEGFLLSEEGSPARWADTHAFAGIDVVVLAAIAVATAPMAAIGWVLRHGRLSRLPGYQPITVGYTFVAMSVSVLMSRLPSEVQTAIVVSVLAMGVFGLFVVVKRARWLRSWFRETRAPGWWRLAVLSEFAVPGLAQIVVGRRLRGVLTLAGVVLIVMAMRLVGPGALPLYLWLGSGGAVAVANAYGTKDRRWELEDDNWDDWTAETPAMRW